MLLILQNLGWLSDISNYMKNSDSDYKAEDQSSAPEGRTRKQPRKGSGAVRLNKKEMIESAIKVFLPEGVTLSKMQPLSNGQYQQLQNIKDAEQFSLNYKTFIAKVIKVTDGDTICAAVWLNNSPTKFIFRLRGIDTPEIRKGEAKEFGKKVKEVVMGMIDGKIVKIEAGQSEKYGKILARIYVFSEGKQLCLNDFLLEHEMAKSYTGKTKIEFTSEDEEDFLQTYPQKSWPKTVDYPKEHF